MSGDRTEAATPEKLRKLREQGDRPQSTELVGAASLLGGALALHLTGDRAAREVVAAVEVAWAAAPAALDLHGGRALYGVAADLASACAWSGGTLLAAVVAATAGAGALGSLVQVGAMFAPAVLVPKASRLNPVSNLKDKYGSSRLIVELLKGVLKLTIVGGVLGVMLLSSLGLLVRAGGLSGWAAAGLVGGMVIRLAVIAAGIQLALAVLDVAYQRWSYAKRNRMSVQDVRDDHKQSYGDPNQKAARRRAMREYAENRELQNVARADAVILNPTHLAVALRFDPDQEDAPRVVARGADAFAAAIRAAADDAGVPMHRDVPLARSLFRLDVDDVIPESLYTAVEEVFAWAAEQMHEAGRSPNWVRDDPQSRGATAPLAEPPAM